MLHRFQQFWVLLAHHLVELRGPHPSLLHLLEGPAGVDALMLPRISDDEHSVLRFDFGQEGAHLFGRCQRGLIEHVEMPPGRIAGSLPLTAPGEEALKGDRTDAGLPELCRRSRRGGESLDRVTALFRSFADTRKHSGLAGARKPLEAVDSVWRGEYVLDHRPLRRV